MEELTLEELGFEEKFIEGEMRAYKLTEIRSRTPADFTYWSKASYWSPDEAAALLLGRDPKVINGDALGGDNSSLSITIALAIDYMNLRDLVLRAIEMKEIGVRNSPAAFLEWAEDRRIDIPEALRQEVSIRKNSFITKEAKTERENFLKIKNEEIAILQKRIEELEASVWQGFDEKQSTYSKELAIAVKAHDAVSKNWKEGSSVKQQIWVWVEGNYPELLKEEKRRISMICNWQKEGGAPVTPSK